MSPVLLVQIQRFVFGVRQIMETEDFRHLILLAELYNCGLSKLKIPLKIRFIAELQLLKFVQSAFPTEIDSDLKWRRILVLSLEMFVLL